MKKLKFKNLAPFATLLTGIIYVAVGLFVIFAHQDISLSIFIAIFALFLFLTGVSNFYTLYSDNKRKAALVRFIIYSALAVLSLFFSNFFIRNINILLALFAFVMCILRVLIAFHYKLVEAPGFFRNMFSALLCLSFALIVLFAPYEQGNDFILLISGFYLIFAGISGCSDFVAGLLKSDLAPERFKRRVQFALPNFLTAGTTQTLIDLCDQALKEDPSLTVTEEVKEGTEDQDVNFEVLIHTSKILLKKFGHVDISIGDTVYSYGCYDSSSLQWGGFVAGGTFVVVPKKPYINNCLTSQQKYIIGYGCHLSDSQLKAVHERIDEIFKDTELLDVSKDKKKDGEKINSAVKIFRMGGKVYKVLNGPFKRYFAVASNCVQLADTIVGKAGLDILSKNSIRTPGAYCLLMDNMFTRANTRVIRRKAYLQVEKEKEKPKKG